MLDYYLTIYENIFKHNSLQLEHQRVVLKHIEDIFNSQFENIINIRTELDQLSIRMDDLFSKSRNIIINKVGRTEDEKVNFIFNYIKELDQLFPPQILITWNKNNEDIEFSTDLYNTIGQRYFSKKEYEKHFNIQYPNAPTLPLKEFLWKNKELVEKLMFQNYNIFISKKTEITDLLNENINKFRKEFKSNDNNIILGTLNKKSFLDSIESFIFTDIKNNIKEKERLSNLHNHSQYSTHSLPDYSTALYGAYIIDTLTTETQPITSENSMINRLHIINNPPLLALENTLLPNSCWAMKGTSGSLGINLSHFIYPSSITIEHLPLWNSRDPKSAPKQMTLVAIDGGKSESSKENFIISNKEKNLSNNNNKYINYEDNHNNYSSNNFNGKIEFPLILGTFQYDINIPKSAQTFTLNQKAITRLKLYDIKINKVQLQIHSNWGNKNYTCIYRVRIHGEEPQSPQSPLIPL
ncbi:hypothetical protein BCR32DRAFT_327627 [Anaeromyces robustus]|uniref:SUN domain-containing protein n=1 Tax=Anaeromyces robustus TaxID=1754192 RepID=A0A1Y1X4C5_9FUNG|nr:hypothetical protein BCR32DRAFT_327627 [Anaeromyces robustus]|eukprot:ORX80659.1 hypothetical protein BCR32DRAFT_327627 [Anaeromyces robustus]